MLQAHVVEGVHRVEDAFTNWYLIEDGSRLTVVDAGVPRSWESLRSALAELGRGLGDVEAVVLTHAHFDHLGFAERARRELGIPVLVHEDDYPLTRHPLQYGHEQPRWRYFATQPQALPIVAALTRDRAWWPDPLREVTRHRADGPLDVPGRPVPLHTPGHTLGHCALHLPDRDCVLAGDALVMLDPYTARRGPRLVARAATADSERCARTLDAIAATGARHVLTGHGEPWSQGAEAAVEQARQAPVA